MGIRIGDARTGWIHTFIQYQWGDGGTSWVSASSGSVDRPIMRPPCDGDDLKAAQERASSSNNCCGLMIRKEGLVRRFYMLLTALLLAPLFLYLATSANASLPTSAAAQVQPPVDNRNAPRLPFEVVRELLKYPPTMNLGEVLGVAVNSKGDIVVLNHPGSATSGPLYGNATTQLLVFDRTGKFLREVGQGVYGLGYAHAVRFDRYDNLWVVDKGTNAVVKFNPAGYVTLNLGRRPEGYEDRRWSGRLPPRRGRPMGCSTARPTSRGTRRTTST